MMVIRAPGILWAKFPGIHLTVNGNPVKFSIRNFKTTENRIKVHCVRSNHVIPRSQWCSKIDQKNIRSVLYFNAGMWSQKVRNGLVVVPLLRTALCPLSPRRSRGNETHKGRFEDFNSTVHRKLQEIHHQSTCPTLSGVNKMDATGGEAIFQHHSKKITCITSYFSDFYYQIKHLLICTC